MAFSDDFNRADGPLGAEWTSIAGSASISSNRCSLGGSAIFAVTNYTNSGACFAQMSIVANAGNFGNTQLKIKYNTTFGYGYTAAFVGLGDHIEMTLSAYWNGGSAADGPTVIPLGGFSSVTVKVTYSSGVLHGYVDGTEYSHLDDSHNDAETRFAIAAGPAGSLVDDYSADAFVEQTLEITPDPLWIGGGPCLVTATGTGTAWSDGANPSTTFSADHGEIEVYRWVSATEWELVYTPDDYVGTVTFSETQYGLEDTVTTTVIPPASGGNGLCQLTPAGAELINDAGALYEGSRILTEDTVVVESGPAPAVPMITALREIWSNTKYDFANPTTGANIGLAIYELWYALNAAQGDWAGPWANIRSEPVAQTLGFLLTLFLDEPETGYVRLRDILAAVGEPDLQPILDAIGTSWFDPAYTLHDDLDYLDNRSDHSLDQIQTRLGNMWGADHWSLSQIVGAASDPQIESFASLHNIYARLQAMRGDTDSTIANAQAYATLANTNASAAHSAIDAVRTAENLTLQDILDRLDTITDQIAAISVPTAPVWPGVEHATVYQPYNLTDGLTVQGPLHGLLFTITGQPAGAGRYKFGSHSSWTKTGAVIFTSDRGDHERAQQFGLDAHIVCPKEMSRAASATLRLNTGWTGTVRRFLID